MPRPPLLLGLAAIATLAAMMAISLVTGVSQGPFELAQAPDAYAGALRDHAGPLRAVLALDTAFLVLYTAFFLVFARAIATPETRTILAIAVGAIVLTALLDMVEDHHILAMLRGVEAGDPPGAAQVALQHTISQAKFNVSYLGLVLFGLCVPRTSRAGVVLAVMLTAGTLVQGAFLYAAPSAAGELARWVSFLVGFALSLAVLRTRAGGAGVTGVPA